MLWILSDKMVVTIAGRAFVLPGYMVWCALIYSAIASLLSWRVGRPLIHLNTERYAREAQFRFALVRVNEEIEGVTLDGGEADEKERLDWILRGVVQVFEQIVLATTWLTSVTAGFGWLAIVAPILVAAPSYFYGAMTFGKLMMVVGAFNQVQQALGWFANNFSSIADWRATLLRVASFRKMLVTIEKLGEGQSADRAGRAARGIDRHRRTVDRDARRAPRPDRTPSGGQAGRSRAHHRRTGRRTRCCSRRSRGLWPWGGGRIARPHRQSMVFMPTPGYVPPGTLREALAYPHPPQTFDDARVREAFAVVGLEHLAPHARRERAMGSAAERQRQAVPGGGPRPPAKAALGGVEPSARQRSILKRRDAWRRRSSKTWRMSASSTSGRCRTVTAFPAHRQPRAGSEGP